MCGRYVPPDVAALERAFHLGRAEWGGWVQHFNVAPTSLVPMVYSPAGEESVGALARWGLIPSWWKQDALPSFTFNARSEEAAEKPTWRQGLRSARCLMPAAGWYEWNEHEQVRSATGRKVNRPYFIYCPAAPVVAIAGLWSVWRAPDGVDVLSCALLTKAAAPSISGIHHRMPVVLAEVDYPAWLSPRTSAEQVSQLVAGARQDFAGHPVSTQVNNTRNDSPELVEDVRRLAR